MGRFIEHCLFSPAVLLPSLTKKLLDHRTIAFDALLGGAEDVLRYKFKLYLCDRANT
jgi:hypothetical protein